MGIWLLLGFLVIAAVVGGYLGCKRFKGTDGWYAITAIAVVLIVVHLSVSLSVMLSNGSQVSKMEAFYIANTQNYEYAINETASFLSQDEFVSKLVAGNLEKIGLADFIAERIKEWRDSVNTYNLQLASYRYYDHNWFTGMLVPDRVTELKYLVIGM